MAWTDPFAPQLDLTFEEPRQRRRVWMVRELVGQVRGLIEEEFGDVWVEGEISNYRPAPSGHVYFTLKDADAQLPVVLFRRQAMLLRFRPEDGLRVLARGRVSVYEQRGQMQLVAEAMEPVGVGSLQLAFEQLKQRLKDEGLFESARKRPLPAFPRCVGIVTSPTGAVIRDFLNVVGRRHSGLNVLLYPVSVQGEAAPAEIEAALADLNAVPGLVDLVVIARGGGSLEDLAAFNSERVARAIASSGLPIVSAVGHETDFTIADFVADLRAPTPSAAAELVTDAQHKIAERVAEQERRLERAARFQVLQARQRFSRVPASRAESRMTAILHRQQQRLDELTFRAEAAIRVGVRARCDRAAELGAAVLRHDPRQALAHARGHLADFRSRIDRALERTLDASRSRVGALDARLRALSPLAVLDRGYALVLNEQGSVVRSAEQLTPGERVRTRLAQGAFASIVESTRTSEAAPAVNVKARKGSRAKK
jgi:exodeoxyribonuclease VII large subunit